MSKTAFLFPGQGVQCIGMGQDFYENFDEAKQVFEIAKEATGLDIAKLCFEENDRLNITEFTQVALLTVEIAILKVIEKEGIKADICAGLSLGEYGALAAASVMDLSDLFKVIRQRGIFMQNEYPVGGAMAAVLGMEAQDIDKICQSVEGNVSIANDNCPGQIVITGEENAVKKAMDVLKESGARKCIPLNVSGPFHSSLLKGAGDKLGAVLETVKVENPSIPYICNTEAREVTDKEEIKSLLCRQVYSPVRFRESILRLIEMGVDTFVEIGPGKTLSGFVGKTSKEVKCINIGKIEDLEKLKAL